MAHKGWPSNYVICFKDWSTEAFFDAANATGSPLGPVQGAKINYGCVNYDSVQEIDGALYWATTNRSSSVQVGRLDNLKFELISTPAIERLLDGANWTSVMSFSLKHDGHVFYGLTSVLSNFTLVYDVKERRWAQWTDADGNYLPIVASTYNSTQQQILQHATNGKLYVADSIYATDDGSQIQVDIYPPPFDGGTGRRKTCSRLDIISDTQRGAKLLVRHNDNDYAATDWSPWREVDLSMQQKFITQLGTYVKRAWHFRYKGTNRMPRMQSIEMQTDLGVL